MVISRSVYMDHSASTPVDPRVVDAMIPYLSEIYANSSSAHAPGQRAEHAVETARETISEILNCTPGEIIFTSGGSESDNLALRGAAMAFRKNGSGNRLISTPVEHSAVHATLDQLRVLAGFDVNYVNVDHAGFVNEGCYQELCQPDTVIASVVYANNEVGTVQHLRNLAATAHGQGIVFHTDAVQAAGQLSLNVNELGIDMLSLSAHKFYGPKGVGALYVRDSVALVPYQTGTGHEGDRRAGTHNVPLIVGMAKALKLAHEEIDRHTTHFKLLREQLIERVLNTVPGVLLTGDRTNRLPSHASFIFEGVDSNALIMHLDMHGVAASSGSACTTGNPDPSSVLLALGYTAKEALGSLRLTVGRQTSEADVDYTVDVLRRVLEKVRKLNREIVQ